MMETDVLVVGAGPAGSTAAKFAAQNGAKVILIEKKSEIGSPKRCAEGVSVYGLEKTGVKLDPRWTTKKIDGIRLSSPNGTDVWLTQDNMPNAETGYVLERKVFDKFMAMDAARAGAEIKVKTLAKSFKRTDDGAIVEVEHMGKVKEIKAKIVIAADGPESRVARWAGLKTTTKAINMESGVQFEMCKVKMERTDVIEFYFGSVAPGGYAWIFPKGEDIANVGLAVLTPMTEKTAYEHLLEFIKNCPATQDAQAVELNVGGDPVGGMFSKLSGENIMVVGDAAGQVNPLTGGGINSGMLGGMLAGKVAADAVKENDFSAKKLSAYDDLCDEELGDSMKKYLKVKDYLLSITDEDLDEIAEAFQEISFDKVSTTDLIKSLIKVSPKALLKLGKLF